MLLSKVKCRLCLSCISIISSRTSNATLQPSASRGLDTILSPASATTISSQTSAATTALLSSVAPDGAPIDSFTPNKRMISFSNRWKSLPPRARASVSMAAALSFHYGGYEFLRNSGLALFTQAFADHNIARTFAAGNALISPFSVAMLYGYGQVLNRHGPRSALKISTWLCAAFIVVASLIMSVTSDRAIWSRQVITMVAFLFQSSYSHMLASQQWSFMDSVLTPQQAARWYTIVVAVSSAICTLTSSLVPILLPRIQLIGVYLLTAFTLLASGACAEHAYHLADQHGFDPSTETSTTVNTQQDKSKNRFADVVQLFRRVPTLRALLSESIAFQTVSTVLNLAFVAALSKHYPYAPDRAAYTGQFFALCSATTTVLQLGILPVILQRAEPRWIWRLLPIGPVLASLVAGYGPLRDNYQLTLLATALFLTKTADYALRSVVGNMVYQPLDFEARFVGKEIVSVFGSRLGKSGVSLLLAVMASANNNVLAAGAGIAWTASSWWLGYLVPSRAVAQATVELRREQQRQQKDI